MAVSHEHQGEGLMNSIVGAGVCAGAEAYGCGDAG